MTLRLPHACAPTHLHIHTSMYTHMDAHRERKKTITKLSLYHFVRGKINHHRKSRLKLANSEQSRVNWRTPKRGREVGSHLMGRGKCFVNLFYKNVSRLNTIQLYICKYKMVKMLIWKSRDGRGNRMNSVYILSSAFDSSVFKVQYYQSMSFSCSICP